MLKKSLLVTIMVLASFSYFQPKAGAYYECSSTYGCVDVYLKYNEAQWKSSKSIYLNKGQSFKYEFETEKRSVFHVSFGVYRSSDSKQVGPTLYAVGGGGNDYGYGTAPSSGYYYLLVGCKGGHDKRCEGGGDITKY
ncbi:hypothetical protein [Rossellomorea marisflavi]|uniref:hypothetical protein n=1 Tax=Rossellomorea marisflavi TaxID=189381 RepID=UPI00064F0777|nr:hypothetical protein [Rossellomorea marisflavi]KML32350.1 hypothetical protein VL12_15200 [Rossellomorea marisflavi]